MIDKKNLNRTKGILSARQGAEIPKFQTGAKFARYNGRQMIYSQDQESWFTDEALTSAYEGSMGGFKAVQYDPTTTKNPVQPSPHLAIPGDPQLTPTSAVESAAAAQKKEWEITRDQFAAGVRVTPIISEEATTRVNNTLNKPPTLDVALLQSDIDRNVRSSAESAGMQILEQQTKEYDKLNTAGQAVGGALQVIGQAAGASQQATDSNTTKMIDTTYDGVASGLANSGSLVGKIAGTAMQFGKAAGDIVQQLGGGTDQQTTTDKWMDSGLFSWNIGAINGFFGKESDKFGVDRAALETVGSSYGNTTKDILDAASKANKKYGLFSSKERNRANKAAQATAVKQNLMGNIADTATDQRLAVQSMGEQAGLAYSMMTSGGYDQKYTYAAKQGGILNWEPQIELEWEPQIELNWELHTFKDGGSIDINDELEWIPEFKNGGKTEDSDIPEIEKTTQKNVIPEGALHKNKHHMEHAEGLTKKGIPVIDDDGDQQAEIEHSEIIFTLEVTKKLEEYYKIFYSDESSNKEKEQAALDAGKLLVYQILENTEDRTGLIDSCQKGGTLTLKKSTDDLIEEALESIPTIVVIEEEKAVEKPKKIEKKSDKEVMKEAIKEALIELLIK